ncbi:MAG TPA: LAGLIDADG family homing endonuclease, partial [Nitrosopumilaceae archaeon]|nr:LAGLIDADG family homing endonuclease [Nitrosopumilaceae archaeon]
QGWKKITATARTRRNAETIKINLLSGRQLILTPDHIIPCFDNKRGFVEVQAKDLRQRHSLIIAANAGLVKSINYQLSKQKISSNGSDLVYTTSKIKLSINLAELLGYMVAEGSVDKFHNTNNILIEDFAVKWRNIFGPNSCRTYEGGVNVGTRGAKILGHLGYNIGCYDKEVPSWIMQSSYKHIVAFLRGAYAGDGNFCVDQSTYATVSEKLARQMQLLLAIVGVNCYLDPYNSGVNNSKTWFLRTTDVGSTRKLFSILVPLRGYSLAPISDVAKSSLQDCLSNNYRRIFRKAIRKHLPKNDNTALVPLVDIKQYISYVPTLTWLAKWLTNKNLLFKQRLRAGGKPHNMARICDVANLALMRRRQIITIMRKLCVIKPSGSADRQRRFYAKRAWQRLKEILPQAAAELQPLIRDDILFDRVVNLEKSNKTDVYDMSVPGPDHFSVNAAIVHNCKHLIVGAEEILRKKL